MALAGFSRQGGRGRATRRVDTTLAWPARPSAATGDLTHDLGGVLRQLADVRNRRRLRRHQAYREAQPEIERVLRGFEWDLRPTRAGDDATVRACAWNVERGKRFEALLGVLRHEPRLRDTDMLLLTEVDVGMGRSENRNVPRELARALGMGYVFANYHLVLASGDSGEVEHGRDNTLAMHGAALLTRHPVRRFAAVALPEYRDKFHAFEKRLGTKRALFCELELPDGPLTVAVVHLDPFSPPAHRARQMRMIVEGLHRFGAQRVLLGGDLNTNTYDLGSSLGFARNVAHKLFRFGVAGTVAQYMTPGRVFERRLFDALGSGGLDTEGFSDPHRGSVYYDLTDETLRDKSRGYMPGPVFRWLDRRLQPWGGVVPMRLDWFAGRGVRARAAHTVERPEHRGQPVSDHNPIVVELDLDHRALNR